MKCIKLSPIMIILPVTHTCNVVCLVERSTLFHPVPYLIIVIAAQSDPYLGSPRSHLLTYSSFSKI